jgi:hypothetical protein
MKLLLSVLAAAAGAGMCVFGVKLATSRPRPTSLGGMVLAAAGMALALSSIAAAAWLTGR